MLTAVIMAGGKGERFWPKSRTKIPKQFLGLTGEDTMIQATVKRVNKLIPYEHIYIITGKDYAKLAAEQIPQIPFENIIVEPEGRNTAPCIGLAAIHIEEADPEALMVVLPADHLIGDEEKFVKLLESAADLAEDGENLVTLGVKPERPETGYGYIRLADKKGDYKGNPAYAVKAFREKPNFETAQYYLESGEYLWNSGMFIWKVSTIRKKIREFIPDLDLGLDVIKNAIGSDNYQEVLRKEYAAFESTSIDYSIMEKASSIYVFPGDFGWDDVGSWTSLERLFPTDKEGNVVRGRAIGVDTRNCIIEASGKLIATVGLEDVIVIDTDDVIMICPKDKAQQVKELLQKLKEEGLRDYL